MKLPTIPLPEVPDEEGYNSENFRKYRPRNGLYRKHLERFHRDLAQQVIEVRPSSILEVGCGEGFVLHVLKEYGEHLGRKPDLCGVDVRVGALEYAARFLGGEAALIAGSAYALPFPDDSFDLAVSSQVLEHLKEPSGALRELARVARKGVIVTVPREPIFRTFAAVATSLGIGQTPSHVNFWTRAGFERLLAAELDEVRTRTSTVYRLGLGWIPEKHESGACEQIAGRDAA